MPLLPEPNQTLIDINEYPFEKDQEGPVQKEAPYQLKYYIVYALIVGLFFGTGNFFIE